MLINKITSGYVVQSFDTNTNKFISQEFIAGDCVDVENPANGDSVENENLDNSYLPFQMVQPRTGHESKWEAVRRALHR